MCMDWAIYRVHAVETGSSVSEGREDASLRNTPSEGRKRSPSHPGPFRGQGKGNRTKGVSRAFIRRFLAHLERAGSRAVRGIKHQEGERMKFYKPDGYIEIEMSGCCCPPTGKRKTGLHTNATTLWFRVNEGDWVSVRKSHHTYVLADAAETVQEFMDAMESENA